MYDYLAEARSPASRTAATQFKGKVKIMSNLFGVFFKRLRYLSCGINSPEYFVGSVK